MKLPQTVPESCRYVADLMEKCLKEIGQTSYKPVVHIEGQNDWTWDSQVSLFQVTNEGKKYDTGFCISPMIEQKEAVFNRPPIDYVRYYVMHEEITRGVHYYPDGSGEPDTSDLVTDLATDSPHTAVQKIILLNVEMIMNQMFEAMYEDDMMRQMAEDENELEQMYHEMDQEQERQKVK